MSNSGLQLKKLREYFGLTQNEFAEVAKSKRNSISMIESGRNKPTFELIEELCGAFNISADYFLSGDSPSVYEEYFKNIKFVKKGTKNDIKNDISSVHLKALSVVPYLGLNTLDKGEINELYEKVNDLLKSHYEYLDYQLIDILFHLKMLQEKVNGVKFNREEFQANKANIKSITENLKLVLNTNKEDISFKTLISSLHGIDQGILVYLNEIREISRELYMQNHLSE